jgi:hypothetical protein
MLRRSSSLFAGVVVGAGILALVLTIAATPVARAEQQVTRVVTTHGVQWSIPSGEQGGAVPTFGHIGCTRLGEGGTCAGGVWPRLADAPWVWKTRLESPEDAATGGPPVTFEKLFALPANASEITGSIQISVDNAYALYLNGVLIGADGDWTTVETYAIQPVPGINVLRVEAQNYPGCGHSSCNPAGLTFRAEISFLAGE